MQSHRACATALALLAAGVLACSDDPTATRDPSLSVAQADSVAAVVVADLDAVSDGAVIDVLVGPFPGAPRGDAATFCVPTISPLPPDNSDDDPVPDSVRIDWSGCVIDTPHGTIERFGTMDLFDLDPFVAGHTIRAVFTDFGRRVTRTGSDGSWSVVHNGERRFIASASQLQHQEINFRSEFAYPDGAMAQHLRNWTSTFTADAGETIDHGRLPAGTWEVNGTSSWEKGDRTWTLAVTTLEPLHFDPSCTLPPRFDDGIVEIVVTRGDQTSTVTIEFTACGQYAVTRS